MRFLLKIIGLLIYLTGYCKCYTVVVGDWGYNGFYGPANWPILPIPGDQCGGRFQSPINIDTGSVVETELKLTLVNHNETFQKSTLANNGHNVNLVLNYNSVDNKPLVTVKDEQGNISYYDFNSLHFHFGNSSDHGSEHQIDGQRFPMEMHSIYFKFDYDDYNNSLTHPDGLVVLSTLYEISDKEDENGLKQITDCLNNVRSPSENTSVPSIDLKYLFPETLRYYEYHGSLTVPPCSQAVTWFIFKDRYPVTECQMEKFRNVLRAPLERKQDYVAHYVANNIRPLQPLHGRIVYNHN